MAAAGEQAPSTEPKMATSEMAQETAITIKDSAKGEKAHFGNYWARKTLPMSRILSHRTRKDSIALLVAFVCSIGSGTALPLMNIVFGHLVGDFNGYFIPGSNVTKAEFKTSVANNALYIFYLFIGKFVLTYVSMFCFRTTGLRISANLRLAYIKSLFAQPIKTLDEVSAGTVTNTITTSANTIQMSISDKLHSLFMALALTIAAFSIAFRYSWAMTLVTGSSLLFVLLVYSISTPITLKKLQAVEKANQRAASIAGEIFGSIRAVFSLGAEPALTKKYVSSVDDVHKHGLGLSLQLGIQLSPIWFAMYSAFALAFWFGLKLFREGHIGSISTVIIVFFSVLIVVGVLGVMVAPIMAITKAISSSTEFFSMIDSPKISYEGMGESDVSSHEDIELRDVSFTYPSRPHVPVLSGFDATFLKGKTTALVGPSGAGKSSIVSLLERWYELEPREAQLGEDELANEHSQGRNSASEAEDGDKAEKLPSLVRGTISIGGHNIRDINLKWWRSQIGLVQQEPFLFSDTILSNVSFGLLGTQWENETDVLKRQRVEKACKEAFADEFINQLPDGYLTQVGESGIKLSGGQRQRLAIARSIVREPAILILDEATSSIDVRGERIVQQALERVSQNRTTIVIAHRLSTIRKADNIVVIRHGQKIEEGTHEHLLKIPDGLYASLVRAQQLEAESAPGLTDSDDGSGVAIERKETSGSMKQKPEEVTIAYKRTGFFGSLGRFLFEQRKHWKLYILIVAAAMGAGCG
ncbi:hypothetical protein LTR72_007375 [Exophiala xenobiotica]|nr:hypothetical protein LTR92_005451 [Exophiala xenobiotica]KAK5220753.1 hypothetical protein LTR72_007375 [Exophiala xenobiotica]KAK5413712.1 hypothetical protein LTR06_005139 [Exophiala xenobiotica]